VPGPKLSGRALIRFVAMFLVSKTAIKDARLLAKFRRLVGRMGEGDRQLLLYMAQKMANRQDSSTKSTRTVTPALEFAQGMHY